MSLFLIIIGCERKYCSLPLPTPDVTLSKLMKPLVDKKFIEICDAVL